MNNNRDNVLFTAIQWNCQGIRHPPNKVSDLNNKINDHNPFAIFLQEASTNYTPFNLDLWSDFKKYYPPSNNCKVVTLLKSCINPEQIDIPLNINDKYDCNENKLHSVWNTARWCGKDYVLCNYYRPNTKKATVTDLFEEFYYVIQRFPDHIYIIAGDFNAWNELWDKFACKSGYNKQQGHLIEDFIKTNNINILNDKSITRALYTKNKNEESSVDLTLTLNASDINIDWWTEQPAKSDHKFIVYNLSNDCAPQPIAQPVIRVNDNRPWKDYIKKVEIENNKWTNKYTNNLNEYIEYYKRYNKLPNNIDYNLIQDAIDQFTQTVIKKPVNNTLGYTKNAGKSYKKRWITDKLEKELKNLAKLNTHLENNKNKLFNGNPRQKNKWNELIKERNELLQKIDKHSKVVNIEIIETLLSNLNTNNKNIWYNYKKIINYDNVDSENIPTLKKKIL